MAVFVATFVGVSLAGQQDLFEIVAPADSRVEIRDIRVGQYSDFGDAQAEILPVTILRGHTVAGSGGSVVTPSNLAGHTGGATAGSTVLANNTTTASGGSPQTVDADVMNVAAGYWRLPSLPAYPEQLASVSERIKLEPGQRMVVRVGAPADALTILGTLTFAEIGRV